MLTAARIVYLLADWPQSYGELCQFVHQNRRLCDDIAKDMPEVWEHIAKRLEAKAKQLEAA